MYGLKQLIQSLTRITSSTSTLIDHICSLKNYTADYYKETLKQVDFPNYQNFGDGNEAYSNFFQKLMTVIDKIAPYKSKRVKGNTQKWFDGEVLEKLNLRNKLFKKFKKSRLHIVKELCKKSKLDALKLIASKKHEHFSKRSSQKRLGNPKNYGSPLNLWVYQKER